MHQSICKMCEKEYNKRYYENHLDDKRKYYEDNKIKLKEQNKKWNEETGYAKSWRDANKGRIKRYTQEYARKNRDKINKKKREYNKKYLSKRRKNDQVYRLKRALSTAFYLFLKRQELPKIQSFNGYFLYDSTVYLKQIENTFESWMSWGNRDKWHVDHIISLASFNIPNVDHIIVKILWHPLNLRALDAKKNVSDGCRDINIDLLQRIINDVEVRYNTAINLEDILKLRKEKSHV